MSRIRTIKPDFFRHARLYDAERETQLPLRLAFAGLWTACDREGRFKWRPRELKLDVLPHDDIDFSRVLDALATRGYIQKYTCEGEIFGCVPSWRRHQFINNREAASSIPSPENSMEKVKENQTDPDASATRDARVDDACPTEPHAKTVLSLREGKGKGRGKSKEGARKSEPGQRGSRLPRPWQPTAELLDWAAAERPDLNLPAEVDSFCAYWWALPGAKACKLDWGLTFQNWIRKAHVSRKPNGKHDPTMPTIGGQPASWLKGAI